MKDFSILIIKPEVIEKTEEIEESIKKRGYKIISKIEKDNWRNTAKIMYNEFSPKEIDIYIQGYDKHKFGDKFLILVLKHKEGNTLEILNKDKGNFIKYQTKDEKTLRAEFGLPKKYNLQHDNITFVYCGIHCPKNEEERKSQIKLFSLPEEYFPFPKEKASA